MGEPMRIAEDRKPPWEVVKQQRMDRYADAKVPWAKRPAKGNLKVAVGPQGYLDVPKGAARE
eukprot:3292037-Amphidinium_carterae.1